MFLQVGFKSLSYEMQEQKPAYDSNALFGKTVTLNLDHITRSQIGCNCH